MIVIVIVIVITISIIIIIIIIISSSSSSIMTRACKVLRMCTSMLKHQEYDTNHVNNNW